MSNEVDRALSEYIQSKGWYNILLQKLKECPLEKWINIDWKVEEKHSLDYEGEEPESFGTRGIINYIKNKLFAKEDFIMKAYEITRAVFEKADKKLLEIITNELDFSATFVQELLNVVDTTIVSKKMKHKNISFTNDYMVEVYIKVCSNSIPKFKKMAENFEERNDPKVYLENCEKGPLFTMYKNEYKQTEAEESIANILCAYLKKPISDQIKRTLGTKMISKMKSSMAHLTDKAPLKVKILSDLMEKDDFKMMMLYLTDIQKSFEEHIKIYVIEFCDQKVPDENLTELQSMACSEVKRFITDITDIFHVTLAQAKSLKQLITTFCNDKKLHRLVELDLSADTLLTGYDSIKEENLDNFKKSVTKELLDLKTILKKSFAEIKCEQAMIDWTHQPRELFKGLFGCTAACPFCGEQCDIMDEDHLKQQLHRTEIHRLNCLKGWRFKQSQVMNTGFCPALVVGETSFWESDKLYEYKNYKDVYPDWSITPNLTSKSAIYWRWFITKYRHQLADYYDAKPPQIPDHWKDYSKEDITEDLKAVYNL